MKIENNIVKITTVRFPQIPSDGEAFARLSKHARLVFEALENLAKIEGKTRWQININDMAETFQMNPAVFVDALDEIEHQNYFMYYRADRDDYLFGNSRMVF